MLKAKKNEGFEALRDALIIRKKITNIVKVLALQSQRRLEATEKWLANTKDDSEILSAKEAIAEERFNQWLIKEECRILAVKGAELTGSLRTANTIFPDKNLPSAVAEANERRIWMDRTLSACNVLQDELQYIAESVYADKNKFTPLVLEIKTLFEKIKSVRQADNRFLKP